MTRIIIKKRIISLAILLSALSIMLTACASPDASSGSSYDYTIGMVTSVLGINDQSFNQLAWKGLKQLSREYNINTKYIELKQLSDAAMDLDIQADNGARLLWAMGYAESDAVLQSAKNNPDLNYAIVDYAYDDPPENVTGVVFRSQEASFLVGYIAAAVTETGKVGFVGGVTSPVIKQFEYGYLAGVKYASKELGKDVRVMSQYAESYEDAAKGRAITGKIKNDGCDVVYQAAGVTGRGVIEAASENGIWAIGVDVDQSYLAENTVLTSVLKNVDKGIMLLSADYIEGRNIGGQNVSYGLKEDAVGIPADHPNYSDEIYNEAMQVRDDIINGDIIVPGTKQEYQEFESWIQNIE